ncbi:hypothetical protein NSA56_01975 [Oceanobacillus caeni]|uniref:hypothetical protein n=1 Tax=Oceanobacillus caeni TaxID=405946 RepID=UPI002149E885|nr:hypothetical protein [Oceanobacillus caeni]MCR1833165.1 hypothetical protein [Oceanobacillus caeni]
MRNLKQPEFKVIMRSSLDANQTLEEMMNSDHFKQIVHDIIISQKAIKPEYRTNHKKEK